MERASVCMDGLFVCMDGLLACMDALCACRDTVLDGIDGVNGTSEGQPRGPERQARRQQNVDRCALPVYGPTVSWSARRCSSVAVTVALVAASCSADTTPSPENAVGWWSIASDGPPARVLPAIARVGARVVVMGGGGASGGWLVDGGVYDLEAQRWSTMTTTVAAHGATCLVTVGERIFAGCTFFSRWALYDTATDSWTPVSRTGAPIGRMSCACASMGERVFVWGGRHTLSLQSDEVDLGDGAIYDPATDTWTPVSSAGAPSPRASATATWTGREVVVWGGVVRTPGPRFTALSDGRAYDPVAARWRPITRVGAPVESVSAAVWSGSSVVTWGAGPDGTLSVHAYDPTFDDWSALPEGPLRIGTVAPSMAWSEGAVFIYGGWVHDSATAAGAWYRPATRSWHPIVSPAPAPRGGAATVAVPGGVFVWGGALNLANKGSYRNDGAIFEAP